MRGSPCNVHFMGVTRETALCVCVIGLYDVKTRQSLLHQFALATVWIPAMHVFFHG